MASPTSVRQAIANAVNIKTALQYKTLVNGTDIYHCFATPGTAEATDAWQVYQEDTNGNIRFRVDTSNSEPCSGFIFDAEDADLTGATYSWS